MIEKYIQEKVKICIQSEVKERWKNNKRKLFDVQTK